MLFMDAVTIAHMELFSILAFIASLITLVLSQGNSASLDEIDRIDKGIGDGFLKVLGDAVKLNNITISDACRSEIKQWAISMKNKDIWAYQMIDAAGKIPSGILRGSLNSLGSYKECIDISFEAISGKYCVANIPLKSFDWDDKPRDEELFERSPRFLNVDSIGRAYLKMGICLPSSCQSNEVQEILQQIMPFKISVPERFCSQKQKFNLDSGDIAAICCLSLIIVVCILSTIYDVWSTKDGYKRNEALVAFSIKTNTEKLLSTNSNPGPLSALHGIRSLSLFWVILGHKYLHIYTFLVSDFLDMAEWSETFGSMVIFSSTVSVDTFFLISGLLLSYVLFKQLGNRKSFNLILFYLHRILRLTPAVAIMVLLQATLFKHFGSGPLHNYYNNLYVNVCKNEWWNTLLYVQNYVHPRSICLGQSWYLAIDMQLFILSPLLLIPLLKKPKYGLIWSCFVAVASIVTCFTISYIKKWPAAANPLPNSELGPQSERHDQYYVATHMRATPWIIGVIAGYILSKNIHKKILFNKVIFVLGWLLSLSIMAAVVFGMQPLQYPTHEFNHLQDTTYLAFSRTAWSLAVLWIIVTCAFGYGGPVNWFLSLEIWQIVGKLSYCMYLVHVQIMQITMSSMKSVPHFSNAAIIKSSLGDLLASAIFAYFLTVTLESPIIILERILLKRGKTLKTSEKHENILETKT